MHKIIIIIIKSDLYNIIYDSPAIRVHCSARKSPDNALRYKIYARIYYNIIIVIIERFVED